MFWLIFMIVLWGMLHSLLASLRFKNLLCRIFGAGLMKIYRLLYNVFAVISIAPVLYLMISLPNIILYQVPLPWKYLMFLGQGMSALFLLITALQTDVLSFAGLRQLSGEEKREHLVTTGFYRSVRHPLYTFSLLILWFSPAMTINSFIIYAVLTIYVLIGIVFEERKLLREFGKEYADYKLTTPMLLPRLKSSGTNKIFGSS